MAVFETVGVASIMPFLSVLGNPEILKQNTYLSSVYTGLGFENQKPFLILLGSLSFAVFTIASATRISIHYMLNRYTQMRRHSLSERLLTGYLRQPYEFFLTSNSSDLAKSILSEVDQFTSNILKPMIDALAFGITGLILLVFLFFLDFSVALAVLVFIGGSYAAIYASIRGILDRSGRERVRANTKRFRASAEALAGIKELRIRGREDTYLLNFRRPSAQYSRSLYINQTLAEIPRYVVEVVAFGGLLALILVLLALGSDIGAVLPTIGAFAFAGYRLLPAAQRAYVGFSKLRFSAPAIDGLYNDVAAVNAFDPVPPGRAGHADAPQRLGLTTAIEARGLTYRYPGSDEPTLADFSTRIAKGTCCGLVGPTGSGKSTFVDLLLGLLTAEQGQILVDGLPLNPHRIPAWQRSLGYVPQHIYLADTSVAGNIAFGEADQNIDLAAVERVARLAHIHDHIVTELPNGYVSEVGERGIRLSGGQRQRLGIARALYPDPDVLILDEATTGLDRETEAAVLDAIANMRGKRTVIIVAHSESTLQLCDQIIDLGAHKHASADGAATP